MTDILAIVGLTVSACAVVGLLAAAMLHLVRLRSLRDQLTLTVLVPVLAVVAAVGVNVHFMFLSGHDSGVVLLAVGVAALLAVVTGWAVLRRIMRALSHLHAGLRQLVDDASSGPDRHEARLAPSLPQDFTRLAVELDSTRQALAELRLREHRTEESRRELISFMSHDLRTPLSGLRALTEALEDGVVTDVPRALAHLGTTVERMSGLVDDLFALSRVEVPAEPRRSSPVSLTEVIGDVASELESTAAADLIDLVVDVPDHDRLAVFGRADDLTRAVANLVANAIRHTARGDAVRVEGRRAEEGQVQVSVLDGCGGIPTDDLGRVFDMGWRSSPERDLHGGGGLGLAITRGVVQSHDGRIAVRNIDGGCRFDVTLPSSE